MDLYTGVDIMSEGEDIKYLSVFIMIVIAGISILVLLLKVFL